MQTLDTTSKSEKSQSATPNLKEEVKSPFFNSSAEPKIPFFGLNIIQPKLEIGQPNDKYEKEADAVADQVVMRSDVKEEERVQMQPSQKEDSYQMQKMAKEEEMLQKKPAIHSSGDGVKTASPDLAGRIDSSKGKGRSLEPRIQCEMGNKIGADFSGVKIHTDHSSIQMNQELRAKAFTVGNDIHFNQGQYSPGTAKGRHLLAHELTHVVQQNPGPKLIQHQRMERDEVESGDVKYSSTLYGEIYSRGSRILSELAKVIHKQGGQGANLTRTGWQEDLVELMSDLGPPGQKTEEELKRLDKRLQSFKKFIERERNTSHLYFQELALKTAEETRRLRASADEMELTGRAEELLNEQWKFTLNQVQNAGTFLNHEDLMGLEEMLENGTHLQRARSEAQELKLAEEERRRNRRGFTRFRMQLLVGGELSVFAAQGAAYTFRITEMGRGGRTGVITLYAGGISKSPEALSKAKVTGGGFGPAPSFPFETSQPMRLEDFEGGGRMTSVGIYAGLGLGWSEITFFCGELPTQKAKPGIGWGTGLAASIGTVAGYWGVET